MLWYDIDNSLTYAIKQNYFPPEVLLNIESYLEEEFDFQDVGSDISSQFLELLQIVFAQITF